MSHYCKAVAIGVCPDDPATIAPHTIADRVAYNLSRLVDNPPVDLDSSLTDAALPTRVSKHKIALDDFVEQSYIRVGVYVDLERLDNFEYRQSLIDDARFSALEYLKSLVSITDTDENEESPSAKLP